MRPWLRLLVFLVAVGGTVVCARWAAQRYDDVTAYRHASVCHGTAQHGCLVPTTGTVTDRSKDESCTTDSDGVEHCTTTYHLRVRLRGQSQWLDVGAGTYAEAHPGDLADLRTWHGTVVRMTVRGHAETYPSPASDSMAWRLSGAWLFLGVALWAAASGRLTALAAVRGLGWLWLTFPFYALVHGILLGDASDLVLGVLFGALGTAWLIFVRER
ncbi:hypothetical protein AQI95_08570 [Streptomyces yokosukanensis]|uniref:Uncharacterized protein n=1 Tax=Streptomyces yokosukanensis TaxID=67386 RepID=A0A117Q4G9_9ACTN|nr:hypothetical protein AQI95_08570 [Streptomyces yokosukanensis]